MASPRRSNPGGGGSSPGGRSVRSARTLVLEGDGNPGPVAGDLALVDGDVELRDLADPEVAQGLGGRLHRVLGRRLPGLRAGPDDLGDAIDAVRHGHASSKVGGRPWSHGTRRGGESARIQETVTKMVCQPVAPFGGGGASTGVWVEPAWSVARTWMRCCPGVAGHP